MITITIYGLDQYTVGHYSAEHTKNIANLFETSEDDILFVAPNAYVFHNGVEQTSWNAIIKVSAPEKFEVMEAKVAKYLLDTLKEFSINLSLKFKYHHGHHEYEKINKEYPRFITEDNLVNVEEDESEELYEGNVFEGMEEKLEAAYKEPEHKCHCHEEDCDCDDDCDCDGECCCDEEDGECCCGHHHEN